MAIWTALLIPTKSAPPPRFTAGIFNAGPDSADKLAAATQGPLLFRPGGDRCLHETEMIARMRQTLDAAGVDYRGRSLSGTYHGFTIKDAGYNEAAAERHWRGSSNFVRALTS